MLQKVLCLLMLKNNKYLNIPFQSTQPRRGKDKSELQGLTLSSRDCACGIRRGFWGRASISSVMPNVSPDKLVFLTIMNLTFIMLCERGQRIQRAKYHLIPFVWYSFFFFLSRSIVSNSLRPHGLYCPWNSPIQNTGVGSFSLLQGIFPTQGSNPGLLHCRWIFYQLSHKGSPTNH